MAHPVGIGGCPRKVGEGNRNGLDRGTSWKKKECYLRVIKDKRSIRGDRPFCP